MGVVLSEKGAQAGIEGVGGGGELDPGGVDQRVDFGVEGWHARDGGGSIDKGGFEEGWSLRYLDRVIDVCHGCVSTSLVSSPRLV